MFKLRLLLSLALLGGCGTTSTIPAPTVGQWVNDGGNTVSKGSFAFPTAGSGKFAGYFYTQLSAAPKVGQTLTLDYTVTANNPVWLQLPASGGNSQTDINPPTFHLFMWRKGDNESCAGAYNFYRLFAARTPLVVGANQTASAPIDASQWIGCYGAVDAASFQGTISNLLGAGFTFGGQYFAGHGIYLQSGSATFTVNSFKVQ